MESAAESITPEPKKTAGAGAAAWLRDNAAVLLLTGLFGYALWTVQDATANIRTDVRRMEDRIERRFDQVLSELHGINGRLRAVETHAAVANQRFDGIDQRLDGIDRRLDGIDERFDGIDERLDNVDERFDGIDQRLDGIDERLDNVDERLDGIDQRLDGIDERLDGIDQRLDGIDERLDNVDERFDGIDQRLDNIIEDGVAARRPEAPEPAGGRTRALLPPAVLPASRTEPDGATAPACLSASWRGNGGRKAHVDAYPGSRYVRRNSATSVSVRCGDHPSSAAMMRAAAATASSPG